MHILYAKIKILHSIYFDVFQQTVDKDEEYDDIYDADNDDDEVYDDDNN